MSALRPACSQFFHETLHVQKGKSAQFFDLLVAVLDKTSMTPPSDIFPRDNISSVRGPIRRLIELLR